MTQEHTHSPDTQNAENRRENIGNPAPVERNPSELTEYLQSAFFQSLTGVHKTAGFKQLEYTPHTHEIQNTRRNEPLQLPTLTDKEQRNFWKRVDRRSDSECWTWLGAIQLHKYARAEYGKWTVQHRTIYAHRMAYFLLRGAIPEGMTIDHRCQTARCVNPWHMEPCSLEENISRRTRSTAPHKWRKPSLPDRELSAGYPPLSADSATAMTDPASTPTPAQLAMEGA